MQTLILASILFISGTILAGWVGYLSKSLVVGVVVWVVFISIWIGGVKLEEEQETLATKSEITKLVANCPNKRKEILNSSKALSSEEVQHHLKSCSQPKLEQQKQWASEGLKERGKEHDPVTKTQH